LTTTVKTSDISQFLRDHCAVGTDHPDRYARCRIGGKRSRLWKCRSILLSRGEPVKLAVEIMRKLQPERGKDKIVVWLEVFDETDSEALDRLENPIVLQPADEQTEDEEDTILNGRKLDQMVGHVMNATTNLAQMTIDKANDECSRLETRNQHLENMIQKKDDKLLEMLKENFELQKQLAVGSQNSPAMELAMREAAPYIGPAMQDILAWWHRQQAGQGGNKPEDPAGLESDPGGDLDGAMMVVGGILTSHPEVLTQARWTQIKSAMGQIELLARTRGLT
jgi:hypothetical protein